MKAPDAHSKIDRLARWSVAIATIVVLALTAAALRIYVSARNVFDVAPMAQENGYLEIAHAILALVAAVLFYCSWRDGRGVVRVAGGALALLAIGAFFREFDFKHHSSGIDWLQVLASHGLQEILFVGALVLIAIYLFRNRQYTESLVRLTLSWRSWPIYLAGLLLGGTYAADDLFVHSITGRFWEELFETYGYLFLLIAAWRHYGLVGDEGVDAVIEN